MAKIPSRIWIIPILICYAREFLYIYLFDLCKCGNEEITNLPSLKQGNTAIAILVMET